MIDPARQPCFEPCRFFRNKHMYVPEQAPGALKTPEEPCAVANCWCNKTMTCVGQDDELVNLIACSNRSRSCYEE